MNSLISSGKHAIILIQFTVYTNPNNLFKLINKINDKQIKILASMLDINNNKKQIYKFIVGENNHQSDEDIKLIESILDNDGFRYEENKIVKTKYIDQPNLTYTQYCALSKSLDVNGFYFANDGGIVYEICCPIKAIKALDESN